MLLENALRKTIRRTAHKERTAIFFTGGLDSTILAILFRLHKPVLAFGAVEAAECQHYNNASIDLCRKIAALLKLRFLVITITRKDYLPHFALCLQLNNQPAFDTDLPAASILLQTLAKSGIKSAISGMGSDEIFRLPEKQLHSFITHKAKFAVDIHQKIANHWRIKFHCPYLSPEVIQYANQTLPYRKRNKQPLRLILKEHPEIDTLLLNRPAAHSSIPESFWLPALALIKKKDVSGSKNASKG